VRESEGRKRQVGVEADCYWRWEEARDAGEGGEARGAPPTVPKPGQRRRSSPLSWTPLSKGCQACALPLFPPQRQRGMVGPDASGPLWDTPSAPGHERGLGSNPADMGGVDEHPHLLGSILTRFGSGMVEKLEP